MVLRPLQNMEEIPKFAFKKKVRKGGEKQERENIKKNIL